MKKLILAIIVIIGAALTANAFWNKQGETQEFVTAKIKKGNISEIVTASGIINPISQIDVGTQVSGRLLDIFVDYNSEVKKGQLLALIDPALFQSNVTKETANLEVAKAQVLVAKASKDYYKKQLTRIEKLNKQSYSADKDLDEAQKNHDTAVAQQALYEAQVAQAQAALDYNNIQLEYTRIVSPVDGIIVSKNVEIGQTVAASFETPTLFNVAEDLTKMKIQAAVVEADIAKVKEGQKVEFGVDSFPDEIFEGIVTQVRNQAITTSNVVTYDVIIEIDNSQLKFKPGMTANVDIITADKKDVLLAPNKALRFSMDDGQVRYKQKGIWVSNGSNQERIDISTGVYDDENTEIFSEKLKEGMDIIVEKNNSNKNSQNMMMRMPR